MNKAQFTEAVAREAGLSKIETKKVIDASVRIAVAGFRDGDGLILSGLGIFSVVQKSARTGRNPRTGAPVPIPAHRILKFRPTLEMECYAPNDLK